MRLSIPALPVLTFAAMTLVLSGGFARAVDLPPAPILEDEDEALGAGWYLRGDAALTISSVSRRSSDRSQGDLSPLVNSRLDRTGAVGLGIGYQFAPFFRADVTADYRFSSAFRGTRFSRNGAAQDRAGFETSTLLLNGYLELPFVSGLTPYLGAGIGVAQIRFDQIVRDGVPTLPAQQSDAVFVWALMAGMSLDITDALKVDLGYRYTRHHGDGMARAAVFRPRSLSAHELRLGVRYMLN